MVVKTTDNVDSYHLMDCTKHWRLINANNTDMIPTFALV